jgi:hypothetical protein
MPSNNLVTKAVIAQRYGVSTRTINSFMRRRVLPFVKLGGRTVRFDVEACDIAISQYEFRSIFDRNIRDELQRRKEMNGGKPLAVEKDLQQP